MSAEEVAQPLGQQGFGLLEPYRTNPVGQGVAGQVQHHGCLGQQRLGIDGPGHRTTDMPREPLT